MRKKLPIVIFTKYALFLCVFIISCTRLETKHWTIPLHSINADLEISLPVEFRVLKNSVHLSDCKPCGQYHTVIGNKEFILSIEDTTGFFTPWLIHNDTTQKNIFYIEEQLYPEPQTTNSDHDYQEDLNSSVNQLKIEDPKAQILKKKVRDNMSLMSYKTFDKNGSNTSNTIECMVYFDQQYFWIRFIQYHDLQNELLERMWTSFEKISLKKK